MDKIKTKTILVVDFLYVLEHKSMNLLFIDALSKSFNLIVVAGNGYYKDEKAHFDNLGIKFIDISYKKRSGKFGSRRQSFEIIKNTLKATKKLKYDAVFCLAFDTITLSLFNLNKGFQRKDIYLLHHRNIDELSNKIKSVIFSKYKNKINHVVFEGFFKPGLIEKGVKPERIFILPHPVTYNGNFSNHCIYDCAALCNSNDENFIDELVLKDKTFRESKLKLLIRSKKDRPLDLKSITFLKGYVDQSFYNDSLLNSKTVFVPLPPSYIFRLSGSIYDALSRGKIVLTNSEYYYKELNSKYPGICYLISDADSLASFLTKIPESQSYEDSLTNFLGDHSFEQFIINLEALINKN